MRKFIKYQQVSDATYDVLCRKAKQLIRKWGKKKLVDINATDIEMYIAKLLKRLKGNTVNLRRSINRLDEETTGKNENAIRSFDMGEEAHEAYEAQVALLKASDIPLNYTTPLFQIPNQRALFKRWKKYQKDNGIEPQVTLYEMRHTFVSVESGVLTDSQLKMLVGHSKNMDTAGVYRHELDGQREDLAAATTAAFKKAQA